MGTAFNSTREVSNTQKLSTNQKSVLYGGIMMYAFKALPHQSVTKNYNEAGIANAQQHVLKLRRDLQSNGCLLRDAKAYAFQKAKYGSAKGKYDLDASDKRLIASAMSWGTFAKYMQQTVKEGWGASSPEDISYLIGRALHNKEIREYVNKFAYKKLSFLESYGMSLESAKSDMTSWAVYALLRAYPKWASAGHMLAIAKTAIHNRGINIIHEAITESRQSIRKLNDGTYESLILQWEDLPTTDEADAGAFLANNHLAVGLNGSRNEDYEQRFALREITMNTAFKPKQRKFIKLLMGELDNEFSEYIGQCNSDAADKWTFERYFTKVIQFLKIPREAAQEFLRSLRNIL